MGLQDQNITHKHYSEGFVASIHTTIKKRKEILVIIDKLVREIPQRIIAGPPFCIFKFVTSVKEGNDVEIGFPVNQAINTGDIKTRVQKKLSVLSVTHTGPPDTVSESYAKLFSSAAEHGIISDEFCREVYSDWNKKGTHTIELQFVIHDWYELLSINIEPNVEGDAVEDIMKTVSTITVDSCLDERFQKTKEIIEKIEALADEDHLYNMLSRCAHVFPQEQIDKLRKTYETVYSRTGNASDAVDAVIDFMDKDPGWGEKPVREGNIIYSSKKPRDPKAYEEAGTEEEKRKAYCFCPIIRSRLDKGMPVTFCYCGAGWYRQQWEGAIGKPVKIRIVESVLKGDDRCKFAIYLPDDL